MIAYPLAAGDTLTRVLEAGSGDDCVVLLHGMGARADRWRYTLPALADAGMHAYAFDLPGHGFAAKGPGQDFSVAGLARFADAVIDALGLRGKLTLVGTSLGGHVLAHWACAQSRRVARLVLVGSLGLAPIGAEARRRMAGSLRDTSLAATRRKLERVIYDPALISDEWVHEEHRINSSPGAADSFAALARHLDDETGIDTEVCGERLAQQADAFPVMLVWGEHDQSVPLAIGRQAHAALPGSRLCVITGTKHAPYLESPDQFVAELIDFCREHGR